MTDTLPEKQPWESITKSYLNDSPVGKPMFDVGQFLSRPLIARVATSFRDRPHVAPVWFDVKDGALWFSTFTGSRKVLNITRNARVAVCIDVADPGETKYVILEGRADVITGEARQDHLRIFRKYMSEESLTAADVDAWFKAGLTLVKVTPQKVVTRAAG